jgi:hypothetical protein
MKEIVCGRKDFMLVAKEISLYDSRDREITEYEFFYNSRSHEKSTSP